MNRDNDRQTSIILAVLGILPIVWLGLLIAPSVKGGLPEILPSLMNVMSDPFHIVLCEDSVKTVLVLLLCYGMGIGIYFSTRRNYRRREEHGSAKWGNAKAVDKKYRQNPPSENKLKLSHGFEREKKEALTVAQQKLFFDYMLSHPKDTHWYPVFYVMANTGMRVGEITGLRWSDIDLKKGIIRVNHTLVYYNHRDEKGCYFSINTPKTKAGEREIPMTEGVKQAFLMEREFQSQAEISSKSRVDGYDDFIFVNRYGDVQNQGNLNKALRRMMRDCNDEILEKYGADSDPVLLPQFSCHILRHTFATRLCESGANLKFIQSILGHADVSTTMNIYVDVTDALKKKEITAFDDYMTTKLET